MALLSHPLPEPRLHPLPAAAAPGWWSDRRAPGDAAQQRAAVLLWHFNCRIAMLAHGSWIDRPTLTPQPAFSRHLLARHGLQGCHDWHCEAAAKRLWLMDTATLAALSLAVGGVLQAPRLRRTVQRAQRQALQAAWPALAWDAAQDPLAPRLPSARADPAPGIEALARSGAALLRGLLQPGWRAVAGRARLRLPRPWAADVPCVLPAGEQQALLDWITAVWVPQRSPPWAWLF